MSDHSSLHLLIGGEKVSGGSRKTQDVIDPATAEVLGSLPHATTDDLDTALASLRAIPFRQAVTTEAGQIHQIDVLHVGACLQMLHQATKGGGFGFDTGLFVHGIARLDK